MVLDDRDPLQLRAVRRAVVDLDALQHPGQVRGVEVLGATREALARNEVQPSRPPTAYIVEANSQPVAERPRTGTMVTSQHEQPRPRRTGVRRTRPPG